jgi:fused signal recognition particle receptor
MFGFIKSHLSAMYERFTAKARALFGREKIDEAFFQELEEWLQSSDLGAALTRKMMQQLKARVQKEGIVDPAALQPILKKELTLLVDQVVFDKTIPKIIVLVGINGSGKTTTAGKLAYLLSKQNKSVLLVAADTFRAAAKEQLQGIAQGIGVELFMSDVHTDPASVVFEACKKAGQASFDHIIIDTAGRLQTKSNLMDELAKVKRIIQKQLPEASMGTLLTIDAMLGQNSKEQAKLFNESTALDGIIATKMDGSAKGGALLAIMQEFKLPVWFYTYGEKPEQIALFEINHFIDGFFE